MSTSACAIGPVTIDEKDLMVSDIMTRETGLWNKEALLKHLPNLVEEVLLLHPSTTRAEDGYAWLLEPLTSHMTSTGSNQSGIRTYSLRFNSSSGKFSKTSFPRKITSKEERYYQTPSASDADPKKQHSIYSSIVILLNKSGNTPLGSRNLMLTVLSPLARNCSRLGIA